MGENMIDSIGNFLHIGYTDSERKRDNYDKLYEYLKDKENELKKLIHDVESAKTAYEGMGQELPQDKIPAREFVVKRREKDSELSELIRYFKTTLDDVAAAKNKAYHKWTEYKAKADAEDKEAAEALKKFFGG
ncbi:hypothetical protein [Bacillus cereus group sp. N21]|uniref:hypothetical protein n=1 Tax=Bacillus cereus group sp. N21 TaxID=2794591 RepID=UPI0018F4FF67|nr:hypothetical protein [Bacillus cereus group sp. N21]MBJ8029916.1 hypothetical protein [Bacillus cereus group sp. N21]